MRESNDKFHDGSRLLRIVMGCFRLQHVHKYAQGGACIGNASRQQHSCGTYSAAFLLKIILYAGNYRKGVDERAFGM